MSFPVIEITVPENLNEFLDQIQQLPVPCLMSICETMIPVTTHGERNMFLFGAQTMWDILDDRTKKPSTVD